MTQSFHCSSHSPSVSLRVCAGVSLYRMHVCVCVCCMSTAVHITSVLALGLHQPKWITAPSLLSFFQSKQCCLCAVFFFFFTCVRDSRRLP